MDIIRDYIDETINNYGGSFRGRNTCYNITDIQFICCYCGKKQFVSKASVVHCMLAWDEIPKLGIYALCQCGMKSTKIDTPNIIKELMEKEDKNNGTFNKP